MRTRGAVDAWIEIALQYGVAGLIVLGLLYAYAKRHIATGRELAYLERALEAKEKEVIFWRDHAWSLARVAEQTTSVRSRKDAT